MTSEITRNHSSGIQRVYEAASKLVMPSLAPLHQVFVDEKAALQAERAALRQRQEEVRADGFDAAVRLLAASDEAFRIDRKPYFERIRYKRKGK